MTDRVYITGKLERQLELSARQTNAPAVAAQRARQIIDSLIRGNAPIPGCCQGPVPAAGSDPPDGDRGPDPVGAGLLRYRKDKRLKNSLKFNLGKGFRLICIKEKKEIYAMFMGDHNSSEAWLDHFIGKRPHRAEMTMAVFSVDKASGATASSFPGSVTLTQYRSCDPLPKQVPQEVLRNVFRGLCAPAEAVD